MIHDSVWVGPHFQAKEFSCPCCGEIIEDTQNPDVYSRFLDNEKELKGPTVQ